MQKVLIFIDWYYPAFKAGGPIQSCKNLISALHTEIDFYVFTSNTDFNSKEKLNVEANKWIKGFCTEKVFYASNKLTVNFIKKIINEVKPNSIYINSMFSFNFTIKPILAAKSCNAKIVLAPRGMLHNGAMQFKKVKKSIYLNALNKLGVSKKIVFQATDKQEENDIKKHFPNNKIVVNLNFAKEPLNKFDVLQKEVGFVKIIFISRIVSKKNLLYFLKLLLKVKNKEKILFDIYGDIGDEAYWKECLLVINEINVSKEIVFFKGFIKNESIYEILKNYHFFILPTLGENFGHSIYEALAMGKPVLISNKTPWQNLQSKYAGWDIDLKDENHFLNTINEIINLDHYNYSTLCNGARILAEQYYINSLINLKEKYVNLFFSVNNIKGELPKVLIFIDWYYPAYKAGGSIQSCKNLIAAMHKDFDFYIFTSNTDFSIKEPLQVKTDTWTLGLFNEKVYYCTQKNYSNSLVKKTIKDIAPICIYTNSMFSIQYSIKPIWIASKFNIKTIIATHGMLQEGAMQFKTIKKQLFLKAIKTNRTLNKAHFQATDSQEKKDIRKYFPKNKISLIQNIASKPINNTINVEKIKGQANFVFISRIVPKKNLLFFLQLFEKIVNKNNVTFTIFGDIGDELYWKECVNLINKINTLKEIVFFKGVLPNERVATTLLDFHFFVLSTEGENFGYAIYESLAVARPILISDKTPWLQLEQKKAGFDISLTDELKWENIIYKIIEMEQVEFDAYCNGALQLANYYFNNSTFKKDFINIFTN